MFELHWRKRQVFRHFTDEVIVLFPGPVIRQANIPGQTSRMRSFLPFPPVFGWNTFRELRLTTNVNTSGLYEWANRPDISRSYK